MYLDGYEFKKIEDLYGFRDWCPDDPYTVAENMIYDWKKNHTAEETEEIQEVYDSFFADDEAD